MKKTLLIGIILFFQVSDLFLIAQNFRGLSVVSDKVVWVSGSKGTIKKTRNGGRHWEDVSPAGFGKKDFREIHAWNKDEAVIMSAGDSAVFLKTTDGGKHWVPVYMNNEAGVFFDAIDFVGDKGIAISDPYNRTLFYDQKAQRENKGSAFLVLVSENRGAYWHPLSYFVFPEDKTESMFAASGSIIQWADTSEVHLKAWFVTGGNQPNLRSSEGVTKTALPLQKGTGCGAYSFLKTNRVGWYNAEVLCAVGGCWQFPDKKDSTCAVSKDTGKTWELSSVFPGGYRSSVCACGSFWVCTGTNGTDISIDYGSIWRPLKLPGYNVCGSSTNHLWLAGNNGEMKKLSIKSLMKKRL